MFTGKTKEARSNVLQDSEDLSEVVQIVSPYEAPFLAFLGDSPKAVQQEYPSCYFQKQIEASNSFTNLKDEVDFQKQEALRDLLRQLENGVINGMDNIMGIVQSIKTHKFKADKKHLDQEQLNIILDTLSGRFVSNLDCILVGGYQKRVINNMDNFDGDYYIYNNKPYKVILTRWVPLDTVLILDSRLIRLSPINNHSFQYRRHNSRCIEDKYEEGRILGRYTLGPVNEDMHAILYDLETP